MKIFIEKHLTHADKYKNNTSTHSQHQPQVGDIYICPWITNQDSYKDNLKGRPVYISEVKGGHIVGIQITSHSIRDKETEIVLRTDILKKDSVLRLTERCNYLIKNLGKYVGHLDSDTIDYITERINNLDVKINDYQLRNKNFKITESLDTSKYNTKEKLKELADKVNKVQGTYSIDEEDNLIEEHLKTGYMISFFRDEITNSDIDSILNIIQDKLGKPYFGIFEEENKPLSAEISYNVNNEEFAKEFCEIFNQNSYWDNTIQDSVDNKNYDSSSKVVYDDAKEKLKELLKKYKL